MPRVTQYLGRVGLGVDPGRLVLESPCTSSFCCSAPRSFVYGFVAPDLYPLSLPPPPIPIPCCGLELDLDMGVERDRILVLPLHEESDPGLMTFLWFSHV